MNPSEPASSSNTVAPSNREHEMPFALEAGIVGGFGVIILIGPTVFVAVRNGINVVTPKVKRLVRTAISSAANRLEPLNRKRKNGSIIRVIASILPNCLFDPPTRIFIQTMGTMDSDDERRHAEFMFGDDNTVLGHPCKNAVDNNDEGVIMGFQLDTESVYTVYSADADEDDIDDIEIDDIEDTEDLSSNPEGWEHNYYIPSFNHALTTRRKVLSSSPKLSDYSGFKKNIMSDSMSTEATECEEVKGQTNEDIAGLKNMVEQLMKQINTMNQNLTLVQNQTYENSQRTLIDIADLPPPPPLSPPIPIQGGVAGPPPPPPPPMPPMPILGSQPLITVKKGQKSEQILAKKASAPSMSDILKDLPNVKLRSVLRSPGGTPVKTENKREDTINAQLENALKKRFESMHSDTDDENESMDKENDFEDSIEVENRVFPDLMKCKKTLFNNAKRSIGKSPSRKSGGSRVPFGQHLLKKRNQNADVSSTESVPSSILGEKNN